jgi:hypothetical protein
MMRNFILFLLLLGAPDIAKAQFAPQVGISGSTGIHKTSAAFKTWAKNCSIERGYLDIANKSLGKTHMGDDTNALGLADAEVISLGDSGLATLYFSPAIYNGVGADFAVFENGFQNPAIAEEAFLELAFVEVSSDGLHYYRFPATSNTLSTVQIAGSGEYMNARFIDNLAGKYIASYGTPFDLENLKGTVGLDINNISYVRVVDVIGAINGPQNGDKNGQKINDPYPTPFPTGGFDLDAIGAINVQEAGISKIEFPKTKMYPNPATDRIFIDLSIEENENYAIIINDICGKKISSQKAAMHNEMDISSLQSGLYLINIISANTQQCIGKFSKI